MAYKYNPFTNNLDDVGDSGGTTPIETITGNSGGAESPDSGGNFNVVGTGSITVAGTANTETVQLTGLTNHAVLVGAGTATITKVGPGATTGSVLQNNAAADPSYSTASYPSTATGTGKILRADGTNWTPTTATYPDTAGASGNVLTSDGTNWTSAAPAGGGLSPGYASGQYYYINPTGTISTTALTLALDTILVFPFVVYQSVSFQNLSFNITGVTTTNFRLGIYNWNGKPTTVNQTLGVVTSSSTGVNTLALAPLVLSAGWYGLAVQTDVTPSVSGVNSTTAKTNNLPLGTSYTGTQTSFGMLQYTAPYSGGLINLSAATPVGTTVNQFLVGLQVS